MFCFMLASRENKYSPASLNMHGLDSSWLRNCLHFISFLNPDAEGGGNLKLSKLHKKDIPYFFHTNIDFILLMNKNNLNTFELLKASCLCLEFSVIN